VEISSIRAAKIFRWTLEESYETMSFFFASIFVTVPAKGAIIFDESIFVCAASIAPEQRLFLHRSVR
jgi:hypothetical protein